MRRNAVFHRLARMLAGCLLTAALGGCVSNAYIARVLVQPPRQPMQGFGQMAQSFYTRQVTIAVPAPDAGSINAAIIEPAQRDLVFRTSLASADHPDIAFGFMDHVPGWKAQIKRLAATAKRDGIRQGSAAWNDSMWHWMDRHQAPALPAHGTVVLLTGYGMGRSDMVPWGLLFTAAGDRAVLVNLRGQGSSRAPYLTWGVDAPSDIGRLLQKLRRAHLLQPPVILFGTSYGAGVALLAAAANPLVNGVIAIAPWRHVRTVAPRFGHWLAPWLSPAAASPRWDQVLASASRRVGLPIASAAPLHALERLRIPVLLIGGDVDPIAPPAVMRDFENHARYAELYTLPHAGHMGVTMDIPALCHPITSWMHLHGLLARRMRCDVRTTQHHGRMFAVLRIRQIPRTASAATAKLAVKQTAGG